MSPISTILNTLSTHGQAQYGREAVTQEQHALQCGTLAERARAEPGLVVACLLHDFGHLVHTLGEDAVERGIDDRHEERALPYLRDIFPMSVEVIVIQGLGDNISHLFLGLNEVYLYTSASYIVKEVMTNTVDVFCA